MQNKQAIQKKYFQLIGPGHYIDVQTTQSQWLMARVIQKDKKFVWVNYDGWINKQDQFFITSYRVAPLRSHSYGYTGSVLKVQRNNMPKIQSLKNYLEIANQKFFNAEKAQAFEINQLLRGQLFVYVHDLLCKQNYLTEAQIKQANTFLYQFIDLIIKITQTSTQYRQQYFGSNISTNKLLHVANSKLALIFSLQELLYLLQILVRIECPKYITLFSKTNTGRGLITQDRIIQYFIQKKGPKKLYNLFVLNDNNGKWYPSSIRKSIYKILLKYSLLKLDFQMPNLPKYMIKDFQQFYSIYPVMYKYSQDPQVQNQFVDYSINILVQNSPFDAKLKSIQQLKKIIQGKIVFKNLDKNKALKKMEQKNMIQLLLDNKAFNPQVFKRFIPLLSVICKTKSLSLKNIQALFQILKFRHESQTDIIFQIISQITQFAPSSLLDTVFSEILKIDINSQQAIKFIKAFTIKAIQNLSKQKSYFSGWFGKKKGSSKYGYYGLNLIYNESSDEGRISKQKILFALNVVKQILGESKFNQERWPYMLNCLQLIKKKKNFGQSIKLIELIILTYEQTNYFTDDKKKVIQKLQNKYNLIDLIIQGFKHVEIISQKKLSIQQCYEYFYDLIEIFCLFLKTPLKVKQIQYLWYNTKFNNVGYLLKFLKKANPNEKNKKLISTELIEEIFVEIFKKRSFYKRVLEYKEFQTVYELFAAYHVEKQNVVLTMKDGLIRYHPNKSKLLGIEYFFNFIQYTKDEDNIQKIIKKTIQIILRPILSSKTVHSQQFIKQKIKTWKDVFELLIQKLYLNPKRCLNFIRIFYSLIDGRMNKEINLNETMSLNLFVEYNGQKKYISLQKNSTIFRLRKIIKEKFKINNDFNMFNLKLNKNITFQQEQDFSVNAMPLVDNGKGVTIKIQQKANRYHHQQLCTMLFKQLIEKQQKIYKFVFKIIQGSNLPQEIEKLFWKTIQLLPLNRFMVEEIQKCQNYNQTKWKKYLQASSDNQLQYKLSIILNLIKNNEKWIQKIYTTNGLLTVFSLFQGKIVTWNYQLENQVLIIKILEVVQKCLEKFKKSYLVQYYQKIYEFHRDIVKLLSQLYVNKGNNKNDLNKQNNKISVILTNKILLIYLTSLKILSLSSLPKQKQILAQEKSQNDRNQAYMMSQTFISILNYGLFLKKSQSTQKFAQQICISIYDSGLGSDKLTTLGQRIGKQERKKVWEWMINQLELNKLILRQRSQNYFKFLISVLYSMIEQEQTKNSKNSTKTAIKTQNEQKQLHSQQNTNCSQNLTFNTYFIKIYKFIVQILQQTSINDHEKSGQHLIYGGLTLLKFLLSRLDDTMQSNKQVKPSQSLSLLKTQIDLKYVFSKLVNQFTFKSSSESPNRIYTQKNKKILFQNLKKLCFYNQQLISILIDKLRPFLQHNKFRKNEIMNWNLHFQNSQKNYFVGIQNLGATCYMNCLFQQLFMIKQFRQNFMSIDSRFFKEKQERNQIYQLQKLFYCLKYSNRKSQTTKQFCSSFITFQGEPINPLIQSDADQFFNTLMDRIQTFLKECNKHNILQKTFQGKLSNQLNCQDCPHSSQKQQNFMSIGVNLKNKKTLKQALKGYVQGQILDGDNAYYCELCDKKVKTIKRLCIKQLPNILVIVLKRFQYDFDSYKKVKINSYLQFPNQIDMTEFTSQYLSKNDIMDKKQKRKNSKMDEQMQQEGDQNTNKISQQQKSTNFQQNNFLLRGAVIHAGNSEAGHYYSFIKQNSKWYQLNDQNITQINQKKIEQQGFGGQEKQLNNDEFKIEKYKNAYILFYERQNKTKSQSQQKLLLGKEKTEMKNQQIQVKTNLKINMANYNNYYQIINEYTSQMKNKILEQNYEANIYSTLMEPHFIHFWENMSIMGNDQIKKFVLLYFHTVILRDKMRYEYSANYFRIVISFLVKNNKSLMQEQATQNQNQSSQSLACWYLSQINKSYIKQFLLQAPKTVRLICASLVITAVYYSEKIPQNFIQILISCIRKTSMTPFGLIFKELAKRSQCLIKMNQVGYFKLVLPVLLGQNSIKPEQQNLNPSMTKQSQQNQSILQFESYFGQQTSQQQAQRQKVSSALIQSLQLYDQIRQDQLLKINDNFSFRKSNKLIMNKLVKLLLRKFDFMQEVKMDQENGSSSNNASTVAQKQSQKQQAKPISNKKLEVTLNKPVTDIGIEQSPIKVKKQKDQKLQEMEQILLQIKAYIKLFQQKVSSSNWGKEFIEKYLFFMRYLISESYKKYEKEYSANKSKSVLYQIYALATQSLQKFVLNCTRMYEPMDWFMRELAKISKNNQIFRKQWRSIITKNKNLRLQIQSWLQQISKPQYINIKDDFFQNIRQMDISQKSSYLKKYSKKMKYRTNWMFQESISKDSSIDQISYQQQQSDFQTAKQNQTVQIRNKSFKIKQKLQKSVLYYCSYTNKQDQNVWTYLQKGQIEVINSL